MDFIAKKKFLFLLLGGLIFIISCIPNFFHTIPTVSSVGNIISLNLNPTVSASFTETNRITGRVIFNITNDRINKLIFTNFSYTRSDENTSGYFLLFEVTNYTDNINDIYYFTNEYPVEEMRLTNDFMDTNFEIVFTNTNLPSSYTNICLKEQTINEVINSETVDNIITLIDNNMMTNGMIYLLTNENGEINCLQVSNLQFDGVATNGTNYLYLSLETSYSENNSYLVREMPLVIDYIGNDFKINLSSNLSPNHTNGGIVFIENERRTDAMTSNEAPSLIGRTFELMAFSYSVSGRVKIVDNQTIQVIDFSDTAPASGVYLVTSGESDLRMANRNDLVNGGVRLIGYGSDNRSDAPNRDGTITINLDFDITTSTHTHVGVFCVAFGNILMGQSAKFR